MENLAKTDGFIRVTSPDIEGSDNVLLGVFEAESSEGTDQAELILQTLEFYEIKEEVFAVCCDTMASKTGAWSGAIVSLSEIIETPLLWFLCRHHMF